MDEVTISNACTWFVAKIILNINTMANTILERHGDKPQMRAHIEHM